MTAKTNAVRVLDDAQIAYELLEYSLSDDDFSAIAVANHLEMAPDRIYKTLIAIGDSGDPVFAVVPAGAELDLKRLAKHCAERRMSLAPLVDVLPLTGYPRGAVTVLGARRAFPVASTRWRRCTSRLRCQPVPKGFRFCCLPLPFYG